MRNVTKPKSDVATAATPAPLMWVLLQIVPKFEILAASRNHDRLRAELAELCGCGKDAGRRDKARFVIRKTNLLFG